jgi:hypothetical protein
VVVDRTPSARADATTPPDLLDAVGSVQQAGTVSKKGSQLQVLSVSGANTYPWISVPLSLDLEPGNTSVDANAVRKKIAETCVSPFIADAKAPGKTDTTDVIGALIAAKQQNPERILVISSGLNITPSVDLRTLTDPTEAAEAVRATNPEFVSWTVPVVWFNLGEPKQPLSDVDRQMLIEFWQALLGDSLKNDTREGGIQTSVRPTP